ncbi:GNAT family N-acetyltransferase [Streptomyces sp. NPDC101733]|uniref:GNAT family N-acetyltransferase n=1 Tax=unclassified Streptomyces TaxID=2593676 RepID=UPI00381D02A2
MSSEIPSVPPATRAPLPVLPLRGGARLRPWREEDAAVLVEVGEDPGIRHWNRIGPESPRSAVDRIRRWDARWREGGAAIWAVADAADGAVGLVGLGDIDLSGADAEFLYWLLPRGRGRGLMGQAVTAVTRWGFDSLGLHRLRICHSVANPASCAVATRAGFTLEGTMRGALLHADGWHDEHLHARLATDPPPGEDTA